MFLFRLDGFGLLPTKRIKVGKNFANFDISTDTNAFVDLPSTKSIIKEKPLSRTVSFTHD